MDFLLGLVPVEFATFRIPLPFLAYHNHEFEAKLMARERVGRLISDIILAMSDVVHIYGSSYKTCPVCGQKCAYGGEMNAIANEPVIRPADWEIELYCPVHGHFQVLARNLIRPE